MALALQVLPVTPFQQNASLIGCSQTGQAALVDPGGDCERLLAAAASWQVTHILLTHGHLDHAGAAAELAGQLDVPVWGPHAADRFLLDALGEQGERYGLPARPVTPDRWLADGDLLEIGELRLQVLHCPGHTPGHVVFYCEEARLALVGDVLFKGSIGRTDLPRGNFDALVASIRRKLFPLGDDVVFVSGHGDRSDFGWERRCNPFVCDLAVGEDG